MNKYNKINWKLVFEYDEQSPSCLKWKITVGTKIQKGRPAGSIDKYWVVIYKGVRYKCHRIIWEMFNISKESTVIDHINRNKLDNRLCNLREVTISENARNKNKRINNKTGKTGVWRETGTILVEYDKFVAGWYNKDGKRITKSFSVKKFGEIESFNLAVSLRDSAIAKLNEDGAGYTETHGK